MAKLTLTEVRKILKDCEGDSEIYHSVFDDLIEQKLAEYDPEFMKAMLKIYSDSDEVRWCA